MGGFEPDPSFANITSQKQHHIPGKRMTEISVTFKEIKDACWVPIMSQVNSPVWPEQKRKGSWRIMKTTRGSTKGQPGPQGCAGGGGASLL